MGVVQSQTIENDQYEFFSNVSASVRGIGQTFIASSSYTMTGFRFKITERDSLCFCRGALYATNSGLPTGSPLAVTDTIDCADWSDYATYAIEEFLFTTPYALTSGVTYAMVVEFVSGTPAGSNNSLIKTNASNPYSDGAMIGKNASDVWSIPGAGVDLVFYTLEPDTSIKKVAGVAYASLKKVAGVAIASVKKVAGVA